MTPLDMATSFVFRLCWQICVSKCDLSFKEALNYVEGERFRGNFSGVVKKVVSQVPNIFHTKLTFEFYFTRITRCKKYLRV